MTTAVQHRCTHCLTPYIYHPSFYGGEEINYPYNDDRYCPDCYKAVKEALTKIPLKYERRFIPSNEYTREQIVTLQEERCKKSIPIRRIFPTMFDMSGEDQHNIVCELMPDGEWYMAEWWSSKPEEVKISKETWCSINEN